MFESFINNIATILGTTAVNAGIFASLIATIAIILATAVATKGEHFDKIALIMALLSTILFTAMAWYPIWMGTVMALGIAAVTGYYFSKTGGGT